MTNLIVLALTVAFYIVLGLVPHVGPHLGGTLVVIAPVAALVGTWGAITYKGAMSLAMLCYLSKKIH